MKRSISVILSLAFISVFLCGCFDNTVGEAAGNDDHTADAVSIIMPESETENIVAVSNGLYYANKSTKKFHHDSCKYAKMIKNENLYITESREELIENEYESCKYCNP